MSETVFSVLKGKVDEDLSDIKATLCSGAAKSYDEYRDMTGYIRGLEVARQHIQNLERNFISEDEDD